MTAAPTRSFEPVADSQAVFRVVLDAMARPGTEGIIPSTDPRASLSGGGALGAVAQTLLDHEVTFAVAPGLGENGEAFARYLAATTGSRPATLDEADYVFTATPLARGLLASLKRGTLAFPDESATLLVLTPDFAAGAGIAVDLRGPGIPGTAAVTLAGLSEAYLAERRVANAEVPRGIDLLLVDPLGRIRCLPRTTQIAVR